MLSKVGQLMHFYEYGFFIKMLIQVQVDSLFKIYG